MKWPSFYSACGTYSVVVESEFADILKIEGQKVVAQAPIETKLGIFNPVFTLRRDSNINQAITAVYDKMTLCYVRSSKKSFFYANICYCKDFSGSKILNQSSLA